MATSTIMKMLKSKEVNLTIASGQTGEVHTGVPMSRIVSVVLKKNPDVYYEPIIYSVYDNGTIEARTTTIDHAITQSRTYTFLVWYI